MKSIIFTSALVLRKNYDYIKYCKENRISVLLIEEDTPIVRNILKDFLYQDIGESILSGNDQKVLEKVFQWKNKYEITAIVNLRDNFTKMTGIISYLLNLKSPGVLSSTICSNKQFQRTMFYEQSPKSISMTIDTHLEKIHLDFPGVIKPSCGSSSKDVQLIYSKEDLKNFLFEKQNLKKSWLFEEYIQGDEYSVECLVSSGKVIFQGITKKITSENDGDHFVEMGHIVPDFYLSEDKSNELKQINLLIIGKMNMENGITHAEYKINESGKIFLMEIACRPPGDAIMDLYSRALTRSFPEILIKTLISEETLSSLDFDFVNYSFQKYVNHNDHLDGKLIDIATKIDSIWFYENLEKNRDISKLSHDEPYLYVYRNKGDVLRKIRSSYDRCCSVISSNPNFSILEKEINSLISDVKIKVEK